MMPLGFIQDHTIKPPSPVSAPKEVAQSARQCGTQASQIVSTLMSQGTRVEFGGRAKVKTDGATLFRAEARDTTEFLFDEDRGKGFEEGRPPGDEFAKSRRSLAIQKSVSQGMHHAQFFHQQKSPPQASGVQWDRFLPQRQIRVLLAEEDDSTRHIVTALLRNCSYEVTHAANGLAAWELLTDQTVQIDLVLTEVVMPFLSGIGLLSRITSHQAFKHIPVIMMSSHDSMGLVFKCLSQGAVDFLVKPVRKNELKNLWQHVWRRCHSSSGSGSGSTSGSQIHKVNHLEGAAGCNNSGSMDGSDDVSCGLNEGNGSDNGSGTQSSWTKGAMEVGSSHLPLGTDGIYHLQKDTCRDKHESGNNLEKNLEVATLRLSEVGPSNVQEEIPMVLAPVLPVKDTDMDGGKGNPSNSRKAVDLIGVVAETGRTNMENTAMMRDVEEKHANKSHSFKERDVSQSRSPELFELTLHRPDEDDRKEKDRIHVLRHSCSSAFSRYNGTSNQTPLGLETAISSSRQCKSGIPHSAVGSNGASLHPSMTDGGFSLPLMSHACPRASATSQEKGIMVGKDGPNTNKDEVFFTDGSPHQFTQAHFPLPQGSLSSGMASTFGHLMFHGASAAPPLWCLTARSEADVVHVSSDKKHSEQGTEVHHHSHRHNHHHYHNVQHHYHYHQNTTVGPSEVKLEEQIESNVDLISSICGSSDMAVIRQEGVLGQSGSSNGTGNLSVTGSNNGSNGQSNAQSAAGHTVVTHGNVNNYIGSGGGGMTHGCVLVQDQNRFAWREAALTKFRQKRKERCFEKRVRYQSRKRLAEQRPRVKGQFVRQSVYDSSAGDAE